VYNIAALLLVVLTTLTLVCLRCAQLEKIRVESLRNVDELNRTQAELKNARKRIVELTDEMSRLITQVTDTECSMLR